jgi:FtsP/CotA-like multicopper oxidase with cupredoxin domain
VWGCTLSLAAFVFPPSADAEDSSPELIQPPICSAETAGKIPELAGLCEVTPRDDGHDGNKVKINLTARTAPIQVGGYTVVTENYNGAYLPPIVEAMPGDTVAAHLVNLLAPRQPIQEEEEMGHVATGGNPTNLHYFHGGIVTPRNARSLDIDARKGTGDNIYVHLQNGLHDGGTPHSFDLHVPIPGEGELDARVLETEGFIKHPSGLNWYHSQLHGISSTQVLGGMSGLLSVGEIDENLKAACRKDTPLSNARKRSRRAPPI